MRFLKVRSYFPLLLYIFTCIHLEPIKRAMRFTLKLPRIFSYQQKDLNPLSHFGNPNQLIHPPIHQSQKSLLYIFHSSASNQAHLKETIHALTSLAQKLNEYLIFTTVDVDRYSQVRQKLGLQDEVSIALFNPMYGLVFAFDEKDRGVVSRESVEGFVGDVAVGRVEAIRRGGEVDVGRGEEGRRRVHEEL